MSLKLPEAIENYVPQNAVAQMRRQAFFVWSIAALITLSWISLILLAPIAEAYNFHGLSNSVYKFFGYLCHQMPDRSFQVDERPFAVCSRCFGVYFGLFSGVAFYPLLRTVEETEPLPRFWLFLSMIPMAIDWSLGIFGVWANTHWSRFVTGAILGAACAVFIVPALIEISRNFSYQDRKKRLSL